MSNIDQKYQQLGGSNSVLGNPKTEEKVCNDGLGHYRNYEHGVIYWHPDTGAHEIHGSICSTWVSLGLEQGVLGYPTTDETKTPDTTGRFNHFQGGSIYWRPNIGAYEVHGAIRAKWAQLGWEKSILGYPVTNEKTTPDTKGRYNHFEHGSIYSYPGIGAFEVHGVIRTKWASLGWEKSLLGYPKSDETKTPDGAGKYNHFEYGSIYWHPNTGAHEIHGSIRAMWAKNGWEKRIGYPKTDEIPMNDNDNGRYNTFQKGVIGWTPDQGAWFDFFGAGEGKFSGTIYLFQNNNYGGATHAYLLNNNTPMVFYQDLSEHNLHDKVSSLKISGIPKNCAIYFYDDSKFKGRFIKITGLQNGAQFQLPVVGSHINDRISSIQAINHGNASVIITPAQLETLASAQVSGISMSGLEWTRPPKAYMVPGERAIRIRLEGVVEETWPDSDVIIDIYFQPFVAGENLVKFNFLKWWAESSGSFAGYANSTILGRIRDYFNANSGSLTNALNSVLAEKLSKLNEVPDFAKEAINVRRVNILPEGFEIVLSDTEIGAILLQAANIEGLSTLRPQGQKTEGSV